MKRWVATLALILVLALALAACGDSATPTPPPTATPTTVAPTMAPAATPTAATTTVRNSIIATITAGSGVTAAVNAVTPTPAPAPSPTVAAQTGAGDLPVYSGLKPVKLGSIGQQISDTIGQASPTARNATFYTSDSYDMLAAFYNTEMSKLGYNKVAEQKLPEFTGLAGNVLIYLKGTGPSANVAVIMALGPLDANLVSVLSQTSPEAANLKTSDSLVIILSGLTGDNLLELQKTLGGSNPAPTQTK